MYQRLCGLLDGLYELGTVLEDVDEEDGGGRVLRGDLDLPPTPVPAPPSATPASLGQGKLVTPSILPPVRKHRDHGHTHTHVQTLWTRHPETISQKAKPISENRQSATTFRPQLPPRHLQVFHTSQTSKKVGLGGDEAPVDESGIRTHVRRLRMNSCKKQEKTLTQRLRPLGHLAEDDVLFVSG
ncbi:uncharacterized protein EHS24_009518 [Apiotrichum porosum]|uniref:Uncharacterized protein n=1 Tax=Apiotrichum porosum TaxID=105984 RepID=A0A427XLU7_9TREE|nr:uncharacterized protein EHS24_009518 [Apiotrichum porosum]RSH79855.1 hypothetical protein EHS24_009518 [Apiotrichum porosum]